MEHHYKKTLRKKHLVLPPRNWQLMKITRASVLLGMERMAVTNVKRFGIEKEWAHKFRHRWKIHRYIMFFQPVVTPAKRCSNI